ncbi:lactoylglutathione lyase [Runella defluvii]|uniref:Lactoylglutathione lyase n=1 Tax=Runella defluvii TaxID=370973 RepID=A0A7W6EQ39_9BACT|nr:VOC family protein [Runella defluvii]MBB3838260.1 lactoylglutathione lyase [Runella defluvii]
MKIEHIAIWVQNLEQMRAFYETYFGAISSAKYHNPTKNFQSYFLSFEQGARLELMHKPEVNNISQTVENQRLGIIHLAISVGSKEQVDKLTKKLQENEFQVVGEPRMTGDGYYESVILDPENNLIEITE